MGGPQTVLSKALNMAVVKQVCFDYRGVAIAVGVAVVKLILETKFYLTTKPNLDLTCTLGTGLSNPHPHPHLKPNLNNSQNVELLHLVMQQIFDTELVTNLSNRNPFHTRSKHWCWSQVCDWRM